MGRWPALRAALLALELKDEVDAWLRQSGRHCKESAPAAPGRPGSAGPAWPWGVASALTRSKGGTEPHPSLSRSRSQPTRGVAECARINTARPGPTQSAQRGAMSPAISI